MGAGLAEKGVRTQVALTWYVPLDVVKALFSSCDADGSGTIDFEEFKAMILKEFDGDEEAGIAMMTGQAAEA